jgi:hypothetical protein
VVLTSGPTAAPKTASKSSRPQSQRHTPCPQDQTCSSSGSSSGSNVKTEPGPQAIKSLATRQHACCACATPWHLPQANSTSCETPSWQVKRRLPDGVHGAVVPLVDLKLRATKMRWDTSETAV